MRATIPALWIACAAVVFAVYGYVIQQRRIAQEAYGDFDKVDGQWACGAQAARAYLEGRRQRRPLLCRFQF
jgi:hypothetical protein